LIQRSPPCEPLKGLSSEDHYCITLALTTSVPIISILAILAAMSIV
uniref:Col_cuticle_N domain-containing protein n=1 Tax=Brugia timori TaxID=42155 RepID=A0A0R3R6V0_9BILA